MSLHFESGDRSRPYLKCDADDCPNRLQGEGNLTLSTSATPRPGTGWATIDPAGDRRDFCADHVAEGGR